MAHELKVVLFEDTAETQSKIRSALAKYLGQDGEIILFESGSISETAQEKETMYDSRIESILQKEPYHRPTLILADRDLSKTKESNFTGLSVSAVATAASRLAIPICSYSRQAETDDYQWRRRWEEGHIVLSMAGGEEELARRAVVAARGFSQLEQQLSTIDITKKRSPAVVLAALLGKTEYSDKLALYSVGDQNRLVDVPPKSTTDLDERKRRLAYFLGYWLWESLLRYPGLMVNDVAAASHLNVSVEDFEDIKVRGLYDAALYHGPFEDSRKPQWWRGMLDDIVVESGNASGLDMIKKLVKNKAKACKCYVDPEKEAGYYCIIEMKPVSLENSKGGLSWFPRGADLTRIGNPKFEEYAPWLGA